MTSHILQVKDILDKELGNPIQHRKDGEYSYYCPFCSHYKPKLQVNVHTQKWHCWVCNSRGLTIHSLVKKLNISSQAIQTVKACYGDFSPSIVKDSGRELVGLPDGYRPLYINHNTPDYKNALHYVVNVRGVSLLDILRYEIGYCEDGVYAGMIIIPSYDAAGNLNYYTGRSYYSDSKIKHKNPPVSKDIIGFDSHINWNEPIILVEGAFDAISTKRNVIPLFGKIVQRKLKTKITLSCKSLYVALDSDALAMAVDTIQYFIDQGVNVKLVRLNQKDPSEMGYVNMVNAIHEAADVDLATILKIKLEI